MAGYLKAGGPAFLLGPREVAIQRHSIHASLGFSLGFLRPDQSIKNLGSREFMHPDLFTEENE